MHRFGVRGAGIQITALRNSRFLNSSQEAAQKGLNASVRDARRGNLKNGTAELQVSELVSESDSEMDNCIRSGCEAHKEARPKPVVIPMGDSPQIGHLSASVKPSEDSAEARRRGFAPVGNFKLLSSSQKAAQKGLNASIRNARRRNLKNGTRNLRFLSSSQKATQKGITASVRGARRTKNLDLSQLLFRWGLLLR